MENKELKKIKKKLNLLIPETNGNINYIFENGKTILMRAIIMKAKNINPHKEILINYYIEKIIIYTNNHNKSDDKGHTALMYAAKYGYFDIIKKLVEKYNIDIYKVSCNFNNAKDIAKKNGNENVYNYLERMEIFQKCKSDENYNNILQRKCDIDYVPEFSESE